MDEYYISFISQSITHEDGTPFEFLRVYPCEMRWQFEPVYLKNSYKDEWKLKYSHTDTLVHLRSALGPTIQIDGIESLIDDSDLSMIAQPANVTVEDVSLSGDGVRILKKFVLVMFPEIEVTNKYGNKHITRDRPPAALATRIVHTYSSESEEESEEDIPPVPVLVQEITRVHVG